MQRFMNLIRANFLGIFLFGSGLASLAAGYVLQRTYPEYPSAWTAASRSAPTFLEDWLKGGQGNFSLLLGAETPTADSLALDSLIAWRAHPEFWRAAKVNDLSHFILRKSRQYELEPVLVLSLIDVESNFRPDAVSPKGAVGLMQLMPTTGEEMAAGSGFAWNPALLSDPKANIELGLRYVAKLKAEFKKPEQWLTAYNMGPYALRKRLESGEELPRRYVDRVRGTVQLYRNKAKRNRARSTLWANKTWL